MNLIKYFFVLVLAGAAAIGQPIIIAAEQLEANRKHKDEFYTLLDTELAADALVANDKKKKHGHIGLDKHIKN